MYFAQPTWEEIVQVLRNDKLRGFKIDIETDSTVAPDAQAEQQGRTELLAAIGTFAQNDGARDPGGLHVAGSRLVAHQVRGPRLQGRQRGRAGARAMGQNAIPPQVQQMQKQLQEQKQQLDQQAQQVKDARTRPS
jgi:hypothetical protein